MPTTPPVQMKEKRGLNWLLVPTLMVAALLLFGGIALFQAQFANRPQPDPEASATPPAIQAQPNETAIPSIAAQPDTTATEEVIAGATSTPLTRAGDLEQATLEAQSTSTEQAAQATDTAQSQTDDAIATSQAQSQVEATTQAEGTIQANIQATAISQSTIKIVSSLPRIGVPKIQTDDIVAGYRMALDESNNKAGNFTIIYEDLDDASVWAGRWDPANEMTNAVKSAINPDVMVYLGPFDSAAAAISIPILNRAGLAMISPANTAPELTKKGFDDQVYNSLYTSGPKNYFRVIMADDVQAIAAANWATELGFKNVYILNDRNVYGKGVAGVFEKQFAARAGTVLANESIDTTQPDFKSLVSKVKDSGADLVYFGGQVDTAGPLLLKDLRSVAPNIAFMGPDRIQTQAFIDAAGADAAEGVYATVPDKDPADRGPEGKAFFEKFKTKYGRDADPYAIYGYESMKVVLNAIERAGKKDRAAILDAIRNTKHYQGALGTWSFDENGDISIDDIRAFKVERGEYVFQKYIKAIK